MDLVSVVLDYLGVLMALAGLLVLFFGPSLFSLRRAARSPQPEEPYVNFFGD